jgi:YggT family protein
MGRPWWYDSYYEKGDQKPKVRKPGRKAIVWIVLILFSLSLSINRTGFQASFTILIVGFVGYLCLFLSLAIFIRVLLSWFRVGYLSLPVIILNDLANPVITPLRGIIPIFRGLDFSPLIAVLLL